MSSSAVILLKAALVGIGGTLALDLYALLMARVLGVPATNWVMVGRWLGHMPRGQFAHAAMSEVAPVRGERAIGWIAHYAIGIGYGLLLVALWGAGWLEQPTLLPPLILSWALLAAPYFLMMPGMGMGIAGSRTPNPNMARLRSVMSHSVFGLGMFAVAMALTHAWPTPI